MRSLLLLAATLVVAGCQPIPANEGGTDLAQATPAVQSVAGTEDAVACAASGGKMLPQGRMQTVRCVITYADAGKRCTDSDQCAGECRTADVTDRPDAGAAVAGVCQADSNSFGCFTRVEDGKTEATLCID